VLKRHVIKLCELKRAVAFGFFVIKNTAIELGLFGGGAIETTGDESTISKPNGLKLYITTDIVLECILIELQLAEVLCFECTPVQRRKPEPREIAILLQKRFQIAGVRYPIHGIECSISDPEGSVQTDVKI
ncbi:MAG: hypothetical protein P8J55_00810, partial [Pseudomonadales bacterium]|nr:hypothetical protein [Pseudomonadales bacterium]